MHCNIQYNLIESKRFKHSFNCAKWLWNANRIYMLPLNWFWKCHQLIICIHIFLYYVGVRVLCSCVCVVIECFFSTKSIVVFQHVNRLFNYRCRFVCQSSIFFLLRSRTEARIPMRLITVPGNRKRIEAFKCRSFHYVDQTLGSTRLDSTRFYSYFILTEWRSLARLVPFKDSIFAYYQYFGSFPHIILHFCIFVLFFSYIYKCICVAHIVRMYSCKRRMKIKWRLLLTNSR